DIEYQQLKILMECKEDSIDVNEYINELKQLKENLKNNHEFKKFIKINKTLSEKNRLLIFQMLLLKDEMCICEFSITLDLKQSTISHHLQKLEDVDLIEGIKSGKFIHYRIKKSGIQNYLQLIDEITNKQTLNI
ncbi:MAG: ArsR/SmtB family transcription factor, partial [Candidatus Hodarchaeota archaeon]